MNPAATAPSLLTLLDIINLLASVASLVLAIVAIWLSTHFKKESDQVNASTQQLLADIRADARAISQIALPELQKYGDMSRSVITGATNMHVGSASVPADVAPATDLLGVTVQANAPKEREGE